MHALAVALLLLLAAPASAPPAGGVRVLLVRHAEALADGQDPDLAPQGLERARCLAAALRAEHVTHVFASPWKRTQQTVAPLAKEQGLTVLERDPMDAKALADELAALPEGSVALVVGHSNTLPLLAKALGFELTGLVEEDGQLALPRTEHDRLVTMRLTSPDDEGRRARDVVEKHLACGPPAP
jgi:broad specificity phosphatase PhoE